MTTDHRRIKNKTARTRYDSYFCLAGKYLRGCNSSKPSFIFSCLLEKISRQMFMSGIKVQVYTSLYDYSLLPTLVSRCKLIFRLRWLVVAVFSQPVRAGVTFVGSKLIHLTSVSKSTMKVKRPTNKTTNQRE